MSLKTKCGPTNFPKEQENDAVVSLGVGFRFLLEESCIIYILTKILIELFLWLELTGNLDTRVTETESKVRIIAYHACQLEINYADLVSC